jgi:hypothetical protein
MAGATLATNQLLISGEMSPALNQSLEILGCLANVDRAYIYEHRQEEDGEHQIRLRYEWTHDTVPPPMCPTDLGSIPYSSLPGWFETLFGRHAHAMTSQCRQDRCSKGWVCGRS